MQILRAARTVAVRLGLSLVAAGLVAAAPAKAAWDKPWASTDRAIVVDAYEFNPIDWKELTTDKRVVGFINKASDGLPPDWNCRGKSGDDELLCKNRWWKYSVTKELYMTRRAMAKELGLKWGAYHLGRPGNPREQADHFVDFAEPGPDELIALDIEDNTPEWMSLADAEIFANQIFIRTGRYPVLYTNGSTAKWIADYRDKYKLLSRLPLWYARYRENITGKFPEDVWPSYALWQFSSMHNCSAKKCPYRIKGAKSDIDVNVSTLDVDGLRAAWPFNGLVRPLDDGAPDGGASTTFVANLGEAAGSLMASFADKVAAIADPTVRHVEKVIAGEIRMPQPEPVQPASAVPDTTAATLVSAYGPAEVRKAPLDPLKLLTETALREKSARDKASHPDAVAAVEHAGTPENGPAADATSAFAELDTAMNRVAAIVPAPAEVPAPAPVERSAFGATERSQVKAWLEASEAKDQAVALPMPAFVLSQTPMGANRRSDRLVVERRRTEARPGELAAADARVGAAFVATR
jgi:GH25 family lysozyme M1 (1,4-beta-N-acetylmuramidase)